MPSNTHPEPPVRLEAAEIREKYERAARWYDWIEAVPELLAVRRLRRRLLADVHGRVLEVAVGTGRNLPFYPDDVRLTALDLTEPMLRRARDRGRRRGPDAAFLLGDAERLPFPDATFDAVTSSLTTCTFPDPVAALREMARVCRPGGRILLLEHGRSDRGWLGRWQDRHAHRHAKALGCHWNREPDRLVREAGLELAADRRRLLGILHSMEIRVPAESGAAR